MCLKKHQCAKVISKQQCCSLGLGHTAACQGLNTSSPLGKCELEGKLGQAARCSQTQYQTVMAQPRSGALINCSCRQLFPSICTFWLQSVARSGLLWTHILAAVGTQLFSPLVCQWFILSKVINGPLCLVLYGCGYTGAANLGHKLCCCLVR